MSAITGQIGSRLFGFCAALINGCLMPTSGRLICGNKRKNRDNSYHNGVLCVAAGGIGWSHHLEVGMI